MFDLEKDAALLRQLQSPPVTDLPALRARASQRLPEHEWTSRLALAHLGAGKLAETEFFFYGLEDPAFPESDLANYVGLNRQAAFHTRCNSQHWVAPSHDKALCELILRGGGVPSTTTRAILASPKRRGFQTALETENDLRNFLATSPKPIFAKPIDGMYSIGAMAITGFDPNTDTVTANASHQIDLPRFFTYLRKTARAGYLFQDPITQDPAHTTAFGPTTSTVRLLVLLTDTITIESAVLKIGSQNAIADNFWRQSSLLAPVDAQTGQLGTATQNSKSGLITVENHPDTGAPFAGHHLPHWPAVVSLARSAATLFPGVATQSWDIALTSSGPIVVEFNWGGDLSLHQVAHRRGILTPTFRQHLTHCGVNL